MTILITDDEDAGRKYVERIVRSLCPDDDIHSFGKSSEAKAFVENNQVDLAFLDIRMPGMSGIELAEYLQTRNERANIIFCTGYDEYAVDAINIHASGYLMKPVDRESVQKQLDHLLYKPIATRTTPKVICFGNFEIFAGSEPIRFKREKTKELLAYLVDRKGAVCSNAEIAAVIWDDDKDHKSLFQDLQSDLKHSLRTAGCEHILFSGRGRLAILPDEVICDYYDLVKEPGKNIELYQGEYMSQYSWSENTHGWLEQLSMDRE